MAQDGERAEETGTRPAEPGPSASEKTDGEAQVREASSRPLEALSGVPEHGEREPPAGTAPKPPAAPAVEQVRIIEAPEATPVSEMAPSITPGQMTPVLPDEKGLVIFDDKAKVEWGEAEAAGQTEGAAPKAGTAPSAPAEGTGLSWAEQPPAPLEGRPGLPVYPPLPRQFRGTGRDIRRFIRNGTFMFFAGALVYFLTAVYCLGVAFLNAFDPWALQKAADFGVAGFLSLFLSIGAFACVLMSRAKLEEPLRRNDISAVRRRLPVAVAAGLIFGMALGGVLYYLAQVKVGELPFPRAVVREENAPVEENA